MLVPIVVSSGTRPPVEQFQSSPTSCNADEVCKNNPACLIGVTNHMANSLAGVHEKHSCLKVNRQLSFVQSEVC